MRVLVFGDSITYGAWDTQAGWVERLKREAHKQTIRTEGSQKLQIINLGIGGDSSTKILKRIKSEIDARYSAIWEFVFVITFGANDERTVNGVIETPIDVFEENIRQIINIAKKHSTKVMFLGIPPIGLPIVAFKGQEYSDERVRTYEERLAIVVKAAHLPFVPIRPNFEAKGLDKLYTYDYIHPNDEGHRLITDTVRPHLQELLNG